MYRDIFNRVKVVHLSDPAVQTGTVTSSACDLQGYDGAMFCVIFGATGDSPLSSSKKWDCKLQECDTSGGSYTDVASADVIGAATNAFGVVDADTKDQATFCLGYKGIKRFIKVVATKTGTQSTGMPIAIVAVMFPLTTAGNTVTP